MSARKPIIAIDGPAASGKGTLARRIAEALGLPHLDTGLLYRVVARRVIEGGADGEAEAVAAARRPIVPADLARSDLRTPDVDAMASRVSARVAVRAALLDAQRDFASREGAVLDGRDIGTVVFPDADVKLFVTADPVERARRRVLQRGFTPDAASIEAERAAIEARDRADESRSAAPLQRALDAVLLDTTSIGAEEAFRAALDIVHAALRRDPA